MVLILQYTYNIHYYADAKECLHTRDKPHLIMGGVQSFKILARVLFRLFASVHQCDIGL